MKALQGLRGVSLITAVIIVAEIGDFSRFQNPKELMLTSALFHQSIQAAIKSEEVELQKQVTLMRAGYVLKVPGHIDTQPEYPRCSLNDRKIYHETFCK